jgi:hypothetical protein
LAACIFSSAREQTKAVLEQRKCAKVLKIKETCVALNLFLSRCSGSWCDCRTCDPRCPTRAFFRCAPHAATEALGRLTCCTT